MGFDVSQIDAMAAALAAKAEAMAQQADQITRASGLQAVAIGQSNAPVDTGAHRAGIGMDVLGLAHVEVGASTDLIVEVPNRSGPHSVGNSPGERVNCVCSHDAVRVLHRSAAQPVTAADAAAEAPTTLSPA